MKELVQSLSRLSGNLPQLGLDGGSNGNPGYVDHRYKKLRYTYDLISGNVLRVDYGTGDDQMHHRYSYDADNRITAVETSADALVWHRDAEYFYYPHGPLQRVELGENKVQGMDYAYTLQGWMKGINSDRLQPETDMGQDGLAGTANEFVGRDAYGESIGYFGDGDYKAIDATRWGGSLERPFAPVGASGTLATAYNPLYNGNIAHTVNSLQPWGGWTAPSQPAQVLAQVYRYDQLNRLKQAQGVQGLTSANTWNGVTDATANRYKSLYTYDANGNIETVGRFDGDGNMYDAMNYGYHVDTYGRKLRNRPYNIQDLADQPGNYAQDIPQMAYQPNGITDPQDANGTINSANNFSYDALGQRTKDEKADIELIEWTASGKMKKVHHTTASGKPDITFGYDAAGNRIMKQVGDPDVDPATGYREHYVLDAQGNIMAIYRSQPEPVPNTSPQQYAASLKVVERPVYGSKRLGSYTRAMQLVGEQTITNYPYTQPMQASLKRYELTDHLGNVATVVTGRLLPMIGLGIQYQAEVVSATLHEPFGLELTGMNWQSDVSRFGFQSQIKDLEMNAIHFKYREYFPSYGMFPTIDKLAAKYPFYSPYAFSANRVIDMVELEGLEPAYSDVQGHAIMGSDQLYNGNPKYDPVIRIVDSKSVPIPVYQIYLPKNNSQLDLHVGVNFNTTPITGIESGIPMPGGDVNTRNSQAPARQSGVVSNINEKTVRVSEPTTFGFDFGLFSVDERRQSVTETTHPSNLPNGIRPEMVIGNSTSYEEHTLDISIGPLLWSTRSITSGGKTIEGGNQIGLDFEKGLRLGSKSSPSPIGVSGGVEVRTPEF